MAPAEIASLAGTMFVGGAYVVFLAWVCMFTFAFIRAGVARGR